MANTYSNLFYHIVFSTKGREDFITPDIEERVWAYIGGIARKHGVVALQVGGIDNHIHVCTMAKGRFIKMDPRNVSAFEEFWLAGWLWRIFGQQIECGGCDPIYKESTQASREANIRGRIRYDIEIAWCRLRRAIFVWLIQSSLRGEIHFDSRSVG
jgi:hypothetical protein